MTKTKVLYVRIDKPQKRELDRLAARAGLSVSETARRLLTYVTRDPEAASEALAERPIFVSK